MVASGTRASGAITNGATADVAVTLSTTMPSTTYRAVATLSGSAIASAVIQGIVSRTTTTVTVRVRATAAVTANTITVEVLATAG